MQWFLQLPKAVHLPAAGRGGVTYGAAASQPRQTSRTQAPGCRGDQAGAWKGRTGERKEV